MPPAWADSGKKLPTRIRKELEEIEKQSEKVAVEVYGADMRHWLCKMQGPPGTPYEKGEFTLSVFFPNDYPFIPPEVKFVTKVWHPNISSKTGAICLSTLKSGWNPSLQVRTVLLSIQSLLESPEPSDPMDAEVATMFKSNPALFEETAREWAAAGRKYGDNDAKVARLVEMGFEDAIAREALEKNDWDEGRASGWILDRS